MKAQLQKILNANVHPLLCAVPGALLITALGQAAHFTSQIHDTEDNLQAIFSDPYPHQLWRSPHRTELLTPLSEMPGGFHAK